AALTSAAYGLTRRHLVTLLHQPGREMRIARPRAVLMLHDDGGPVAALVAAEDDLAGSCSLDFLSVRSPQIDALVELHLVRNRVPPPAEGRGHRTGNRLQNVPE